MKDFSIIKHKLCNTQEEAKIPEVPGIMEEASKFENLEIPPYK